MKQPLLERFQQLAGIKSLYEKDEWPYGGMPPAKGSPSWNAWQDTLQKDKEDVKSLEFPSREPAPMGTEFKANLSSIMDTYAPYFILETMAKIYGERDYPEAEKYFKKMSWATQDDLSAPEEKEVDLGDGPSSWYGKPGKQWTGD